MKAGALRIVAALFLGAGIVGFVFMPLQAEAHPPERSLNADILKLGYWGGAPDPLIPCTGIFDIQTKNGVVRPAPAQTAGLETCTSLCDIVHALQHIIYFALTIEIFIIVPVLVFVGGFMVLVSGGNPTSRGNGLKTIKSAVIGLAIALCAFLIVNTFLWLIFNNTGDSTIYTYTGDALNKSTQGTAITWPVISCKPGSANPIGPVTPALRAETSAAECTRYCTSQGRASAYNANGNPKCTCGSLLPSTTAQACGDGGTCGIRESGPGCPTGQMVIPGTCSDPRLLCCKVRPAATPPSTQTPTGQQPTQDAQCSQAGGTCINTTSQQCTNGRIQSGLCPSGGSNVRCCIPNSSSGNTNTGNTSGPVASPGANCTTLGKGCWYKKLQVPPAPDSCLSGIDKASCTEVDAGFTSINKSCYQRIECP